MPLLLLTIVQAALGQGGVPEPEHAANPVYTTLLASGLKLGGASVSLTPPLIVDGQSADAQHLALREVAGSEQAASELLRDSVSAPIKLKVRNVDSPDGTVRVVDLWFVVHAALDEFNLDELTGQAPKEGATEVGNMRFEGKPLSSADLAKRGLRAEGAYDRYLHSSALLLDRIHVETTNRAVVTRSPHSVVAASLTASALTGDPEFPNRWWPIVRRAGREEAGAARPYAGGCSYAKASRLLFRPGALLVEVHGAFDEPKAWFDGAPILRSKISLIAQDQARHLRREVVRRRKPAGRPAAAKG